MSRVQQTLLLIAVTLFAVGPLIVRAGIGDRGLPTPDQSPDKAIFYALATLPGLIGLANYVSSQRTRYELQKSQLHSVASRTHASFTDPTKFEPLFVSWLTGSLLLTGVFMIVAVLARYADLNNHGIDGIVYAGYGTYVATLWFMLGRLNAHALSPRFLVNSAIKAAIAILIGFIASSSLGFFQPAVPPAGGTANAGATTHMLLFMVGFFHDWALAYIRKKAVDVFQPNQNAATELPVGMIEGVDDATADLLDEMGISSVQHLATQNPLELSMRSLYPIKRVVDWIDQALLTLYFRDKIVAARELGIRGMTDFIAIYEQASALLEGRQQQSKDVMTSLAQKLGMPESALYLMADACRHEESVKFLYKLRYVDAPLETEKPAPDDPVKQQPTDDVVNVEGQKEDIGQAQIGVKPVGAEQNAATPDKKPEEQQGSPGKAPDNGKSDDVTH